MKMLLLAGVVTVSVLAGFVPAGAQPVAEPAPDHRALVVSIPNHRTKAEARRQVNKALAGIERDYGFFLTIEHQAWTGDRLHLRVRILGQPVVGHIDVKKTRVNLRVLLPGSLTFLVDLAQPAILKAGTQVLARKSKPALRCWPGKKR